MKLGKAMKGGMLGTVLVGVLAAALVTVLPQFLPSLGGLSVNLVLIAALLVVPLVVGHRLPDVLRRGMLVGAGFAIFASFIAGPLSSVVGQKATQNKALTLQQMSDPIQRHFN